MLSHCKELKHTGTVDVGFVQALQREAGIITATRQARVRRFSQGGENDGGSLNLFGSEVGKRSLEWDEHEEITKQTGGFTRN